MNLNAAAAVRVFESSGAEAGWWCDEESAGVRAVWRLEVAQRGFRIAAWIGGRAGCGAAALDRDSATAGAALPKELPLVAALPQWWPLIAPDGAGRLLETLPGMVEVEYTSLLV